jgi:hypothetical protein
VKEAPQTRKRKENSTVCNFLIFLHFIKWQFKIKNTDASRSTKKSSTLVTSPRAPYRIGHAFRTALSLWPRRNPGQWRLHVIGITFLSRHGT